MRWMKPEDRVPNRQMGQRWAITHSRSIAFRSFEEVKPAWAAIQIEATMMKGLGVEEEPPDAPSRCVIAELVNKRSHYTSLICFLIDRLMGSAQCSALRTITPP